MSRVARWLPRKPLTKRSAPWHSMAIAKGSIPVVSGGHAGGALVDQTRGSGPCSGSGRAIRRVAVAAGRTGWRRAVLPARRAGRRRAASTIPALLSLRNAVIAPLPPQRCAVAVALLALSCTLPARGQGNAAPEDGQWRGTYACAGVGRFAALPPFTVPVEFRGGGADRREPGRHRQPDGADDAAVRWPGSCHGRSRGPAQGRPRPHLADPGKRQRRQRAADRGRPDVPGGWPDAGAPDLHLRPEEASRPEEAGRRSAKAAQRPRRAGRRTADRPGAGRGHPEGRAAIPPCGARTRRPVVPLGGPRRGSGCPPAFRHAGQGAPDPDAGHPRRPGQRAPGPTDPGAGRKPGGPGCPDHAGGDELAGFARRAGVPRQAGSALQARPVRRRQVGGWPGAGPCAAARRRHAHPAPVAGPVRRGDPRPGHGSGEAGARQP